MTRQITIILCAVLLGAPLLQIICTGENAAITAAVLTNPIFILTTVPPLLFCTLFPIVERLARRGE